MLFLTVLALAAWTIPYCVASSHSVNSKVSLRAVPSELNEPGPDPDLITPNTGAQSPTITTTSHYNAPAPTPWSKRDAAPAASCFCPGSQIGVSFGGHCECIDDHFGIKNRDAAPAASCFCPGNQIGVSFGGHCQCIDDHFGIKKRDAAPEIEETSCFCPGSQIGVSFGGQCECIDDHFGIKKRDGAPEIEEASCFCPSSQIGVSFGGHCQCIDDHFGIKKRDATVPHQTAPNCACAADEITVFYQDSCKCFDGTLHSVGGHEGGLQTDPEPGSEIINCFCPGTKLALFFGDICQCFDNPSSSKPKREAAVPQQGAPNCQCGADQTVVFFRDSCECIDGTIPSIGGRNAAPEAHCPRGIRRSCYRGDCWCKYIREAKRAAAPFFIPPTTFPLPSSSFCGAKTCPEKNRYPILVNGNCVCVSISPPVLPGVFNPGPVEGGVTLPPVVNNTALPGKTHA